MKLIWKIEDQDIEKTKTLYARYKQKAFVQHRIKRNIEQSDHEVTESLFWKDMVACLLTTQQRSGPNSRVMKFISKNPFALDYSVCSGNDTIKSFVEDKITAFGGIRRAKRIAEEINENLFRLESGG